MEQENNRILKEWMVSKIGRAIRVAQKIFAVIGIAVITVLIGMGLIVGPRIFPAVWYALENPEKVESLRKAENILKIQAEKAIDVKIQKGIDKISSDPR